MRALALIVAAAFVATSPVLAQPAPRQRGRLRLPDARKSASCCRAAARAAWRTSAC